MAPAPAARARLPRSRRLAGLLVLASALVLVPAAPTAPGAPAATATLQLIVTGDDGKVIVPGAADCDITQTRDQGESCLYTLQQGQEITLQPSSAGHFVGWSLFECPGTGACTVRMDSDRTVVATFTPTSLTIALTGGLQDENGNAIDGTVTSSDGTIDCRASDQSGCAGEFDAFAEVTLTAAPASAFERWSGSACAAAGESPTCTLALSGDDVVGAKFKDTTDIPQIVPPRQPEELEVVVAPPGGGTVVSTPSSRFGEAISCSPTCKARFEQGEWPSLTASPATRFVRWQNASGYCTTSPTCKFPAFAATSIEAVFSPPPPPPPPPPPAFKAVLTKVSILTSGRSRTLALQVLVNSPAKATLRVLQKGKGLAVHSYPLRTGRTTLRFLLPQKLKAGWYLATIRFASQSGQALVRSRAFHLKQ
jgi:Divergent InlB B-repeat domain